MWDTRNFCDWTFAKISVFHESFHYRKKFCFREHVRKLFFDSRENFCKNESSSNLVKLDEFRVFVKMGNYIFVSTLLREFVDDHRGVIEAHRGVIEDLPNLENYSGIIDVHPRVVSDYHGVVKDDLRGIEAHCGVLEGFFRWRQMNHLFLLNSSCFCKLTLL